MKNHIKKQLRNTRDLYKTKRKTKIQNFELESFIESVKEEKIHILVDKLGYIFSLDENHYEKTSKEILDEIRYDLTVSNTDLLSVITKDGYIIKEKVIKIPRDKDKKALIQSLFNISLDDVVWIGVYSDLLKNKFLFTTKKGFVKQMLGRELEGNRRRLVATNLEKDDELLSVLLLDDEADKELVVVTNSLEALRFKLENVPMQKKQARGVVGVRLDEDEVAQIYVVHPGDKSFKHNNKKYYLRNLKLKKRAQTSIQL